MKGFLSTVLETTTVDAAAEARRRERDEYRRTQLDALIQRTGWPELDSADLVFERHWITHRDGRRFRVNHGEPYEHGPIAAWFRDDAGVPHFLEAVR